MRALRKLLTIALALAMGLSLLAPWVRAADDSEYTITLSNEPVGYAVLSFIYEGENKQPIAWVVPDGTTISVPVPEGCLWDWEGWYYGEDPYANYDFSVPLVNEPIPDNCILCYENDLIYEDDWLMLDETPYIVTQSCLDFIIAEDSDETTVTMLPAGLALSKDGYLADSWALSSIDRAVGGIMPEGMDLEYYTDLRESASRSTFAVIAVGLYEAMSGKSAVEETKDAENAPFTDVVDDPYIQQAYALGFVNGDSETTFGPDRNLSREDAATMLGRVYEKLGGTIPAVSAVPFADDGDMYSYAKSPVAFMVENGILNGVGDNKFNPKGYIKTEEALIIALRMLDTLKVTSAE